MVKRRAPRKGGWMALVMAPHGDGEDDQLGIGPQAQRDRISDRHHVSREQHKRVPDHRRDMEPGDPQRPEAVGLERDKEE